MSVRQFLYVLYQTTRASFLAQEKNSSLGLIWHLLNPILMTAVLFLVFSQLDRLRDIEHYHLFILVGLIHFNFFINATTRSSSYFIASRSLILNTTVPLELLVLRQTCIEGITLIVEVILVLVIGAFWGVDFNAWILIYPVVFLSILLLSLGASLLLCALTVFLTDLNYVWALICRVLFFLTPVLFSPDLLEQGIARTVLELNPLTIILSLAREALIYGGPVSPLSVVSALLSPILVLLLGWFVFRATKSRIPDYI